MIWLLFIFMFCHFLADYPLQGDFLAKAKNRNTNVGKVFWKHALLAHSFIHAGFVGIIAYLYTGSSNVGLTLGILEGLIHAFTDFLKCENKINLNEDQLTHIICKIMWTVIATIFVL